MQFLFRRTFNPSLTLGGRPAHTPRPRRSCFRLSDGMSVSARRCSAGEELPEVGNSPHYRQTGYPQKPGHVSSDAGYAGYGHAAPWNDERCPRNPEAREHNNYWQCVHAANTSKCHGSDQLADAGNSGKATGGCHKSGRGNVSQRVPIGRGRSCKWLKRMAPQVGLEPTTLRLTAGCSAIELLRSVVDWVVPGRWVIEFHHSIPGPVVKTRI